MNHSAPVRPRSTPAGFTLIEVLVALVVLSVGLIAVAAMQVKGLQFANTAITSNRAVELAADMADRIRANSAAALGGADYVVGNGAAGAAPAACADTVGNTVNAPCTPAQLAAYDIWQWKTSMESAAGNGLNQGTGQIQRAVGADGEVTFTITITWNDRGEDRTYATDLVL